MEKIEVAGMIYEFEDEIRLMGLLDENADRVYEGVASDPPPPPNDPLTLEQLRKMDGEPVWIVCGAFADWRIPEFIDMGAYKGFIKFTDRSAEPIADYGKNWLAYRRRPEDGTT